MKCEDCRVLLSALLDGELSEEERAAVTAHLSECDDCRATFNDLCAAHELLASMGEEDAPEGFSTRVMTRVRAQRRRRILRRAIGAAACLVLTVGAGGLFFSAGLGQSAAPMDADCSAAVDMEINAEEPMATESTAGGMLFTANDEVYDAPPSDELKTEGYGGSETPQPVLRMVSSAEAEEFLACNALPGTQTDEGAKLYVRALRELPEDVVLVAVDDALEEDVLLNWAEDSTVYVELIEIAEETE